jgi:broad specificity phosphatase PhoE
LSELGYMQSLLLAKRLSKIKFKEFYSSDAKRSLKTANEIYQALENNEEIKIIECPLLREKNFGVLEGKKLDDIKKILSVYRNIYNRKIV